MLSLNLEKFLRTPFFYRKPLLAASVETIKHSNDNKNSPSELLKTKSCCEIRYFNRFQATGFYAPKRLENQTFSGGIERDH